MMFPSIVLGAVGSILALASALPEQCVALCEAARGGHLDKARELQAGVHDASKVIVSQSGIPGVKYAMDLTGYKGGLPRLPLQSVHEDQRKAIEKVTAKLDARELARLSGAVSV
jgi:4-hydroxy-2-oxoglutarate aldolase